MASGFKRAFKIKDFGDSIPGHGGLTDRFDCQIMMAMFTYVYISIIVFKQGPNVEKVLNEIIAMSPEEREHVLKALQQSLN